MTRAQAEDRFLTLYGFGIFLALLLRLVDAPRAVDLAFVVPWCIGCAVFGLTWLGHGIADGSLVRALPDYGWALFGLLVIAAGCALATLLVLLRSGSRSRRIS